ncbi:chymotrypsin inhibitor-like [Pogonomyrmex barbatus]|uniref:Chymotrypsin inhibitor-like n=1 Tax=Pogonomyrmex barbatus TaxID=144034 RepID=A0A6I9WG35_9HYME|nr:chymotrypsin inhibitor-like [Pogonomyrmex barbatus]
MSRTSFILLVVIGVLCSMTAAQQFNLTNYCSEPNPDWTNCSIACLSTCTYVPKMLCILPCVIDCQCNIQEQELVNSDASCVPPLKC